MAVPTPAQRRARVTVAAGVAAIAVIVVAGLALTRGDSWQRSGPPLTVAGWAPYWQPDAALASFQANSELFSDVSVQAYQVVASDSIVAYDQVPADMVPRYRSATTARKVPLLATIVDETAAGTMAAVLADPAQRAVHEQAIVALVVNNEFDGVDLDYEKFAFSDDRSTWSTTRPNWITFLTELSAALHPLGKQLVVSVPPIYDNGQTGDSGYWVYDHAAMAPLVDRIRIMAYDYSYQGGKPGPIAPMWWVKSLVGALSDSVDPAKLDLGIPTYGYSWVQSTAGTCPADQTPETEPISTDHAARDTVERGVTPTWDEDTAELTYQYVETLTGTDANGAATTCTVNRIVHYLDARAVHLRAYVAYRNDWHGVALWALGNDDAATWQGLHAARLGEQTWPTTPSSP